MASHVKMPCGWGCGARLGARTIAAHFSRCPCRPMKPGDQITPEMIRRAVAQPKLEPEAIPALRETQMITLPARDLQWVAKATERAREIYAPEPIPERRVLVPIEEL